MTPARGPGQPPEPGSKGRAGRARPPHPARCGTLHPPPGDLPAAERRRSPRSPSRTATAASGRGREARLLLRCLSPRLPLRGGRRNELVASSLYRPTLSRGWSSLDRSQAPCSAFLPADRGAGQGLSVSSGCPQCCLAVWLRLWLLTAAPASSISAPSVRPADGQYRACWGAGPVSWLWTCSCRHQVAQISSRITGGRGLLCAAP